MNSSCYGSGSVYTQRGVVPQTNMSARIKHSLLVGDVGALTRDLASAALQRSKLKRHCEVNLGRPKSSIHCLRAWLL